MKSGKSLQELAVELERQRATKVDYIVSPKVMNMTRSSNRMEFLGEDLIPVDSFGINPLAHRQLATKLNIPFKYYQLMQEKEPSLLAENVNTWLYKTDEHRLVRTLDGNMRAFLSKGYRPLDNYDLANAVLPILENMDCKVLSCEITEHKMYLKAVTEKITRELSVGDIVQSGICISNSEVGLGRLSVEPLVYTLRCKNGMIVNDYAMRKNHVGRRYVESEDISEFMRDETKIADDKAFWMKVQDLTKATMDEVKFATITDRIENSTQRQITGDIVKLVERVGKNYLFTESDQNSVLGHLIAYGNLTQYGLANAVTRAAQEVESYDRSTDLEHKGADIIALSNNEWSALNRISSSHAA
jgi:hypothetical protein